jgi:ABC-2 type transport system permease protein
MTSQIRTAIMVEARKLVASRVVLAATVLIVAGITTLTASLAAAADAGNDQILAQLGDLADEDGWERLVGLAIQDHLNGRAPRVRCRDGLRRGARVRGWHH